MHKTARCFISKVYAVYKEPIHLSGFITILGVLYAIYMHISAFVDAADANTVAVVSHEARIVKMEDWKNQVNVNFAVIQQEVHDIHERVVGKK